MRQNNISLTLSIRVQRFLDYAYAKTRTNVSMQNIKVFGLLSESLRDELSCELALPQLNIHPLFEHLSKVALPTMQRLAHHGVSHKSLAHGDSLFYPGENATHCYWVETGQLQYVKMSIRKNQDDKAGQQLVDEKEDWIAEPILWTTNWVHLGVLVATRETDLLLVNPAKFSEAICLNPPTYVIVKSYARNFIEWLNAEEDQNDIIQGDQLADHIRTFLPIEERNRESEMGLQEEKTNHMLPHFLKRAATTLTLGRIDKSGSPAHNHSSKTLKTSTNDDDSSDDSLGN